jgi:hypothetical protein
MASRIDHYINVLCAINAANVVFANVSLRTSVIKPWLKPEAKLLLILCTCI